MDITLKMVNVLDAIHLALLVHQLINANHVLLAIYMMALVLVVLDALQIV